MDENLQSRAKKMRFKFQTTSISPTGAASRATTGASAAEAAAAVAAETCAQLERVGSTDALAISGALGYYGVALTENVCMAHKRNFNSAR